MDWTIAGCTCPIDSTKLILTGETVIVQKILEGLAIVCALALFVATSKDRPLEPVPIALPYQHLMGVDEVGYTCTFEGDFDVEVFLTNLSSVTTQVDITVGVTGADSDTAAEPESYLRTETIEVAASTLENRSPEIFLWDSWEAMVEGWSSMGLTLSTAAEHTDIVVEGRTLYDLVRLRFGRWE